MTAAKSSSISLRAWPKEDKSRDSLQNLIACVNEQRGSFRNITEDSLEEEIRAAEVGDSDFNEPDTKILADDGQESKAKSEEVATARERILEHVAYGPPRVPSDLSSCYVLDRLGWRVRKPSTSYPS